jgi:hypothetical protein
MADEALLPYVLIFGCVHCGAIINRTKTIWRKRAADFFCNKDRIEQMQNKTQTKPGSKTYEVGFLTEKFQHLFYMSCREEVNAKSFAHAVFHYYDTPAEWGKKQHITAIAAVDPKSCIPDFLHVTLQYEKEWFMPEESKESLAATRKIAHQMIEDGCVPMAIYDEENKTMTVYATKKLEVDPQAGASSVVLNFSNFGGVPGRKG